MVRDMTEMNKLHWDEVAKFGELTPIEIRFHANHSQKSFQLLASASERGVVYYTLHYNPRGNYSMSLNYLSGHDKSEVTLPMKAYSGWQHDVLAWIMSMPNYTIDQVF
jgi:hypothetical protein